jgi:hypothetical protein
MEAQIVGGVELFTRCAALEAAAYKEVMQEVAVIVRHLGHMHPIERRIEEGVGPSSLRLPRLNIMPERFHAGCGYVGILC